MALPVSCIITSYNNRATLTDAVRSVLAQTAPVMITSVSKTKPIAISRYV